MFLRVPDPALPPPVEGNLLLSRLCGAETRFITPEQYRDRAAVMDAAANAKTEALPEVVL